MKQHPPLSLCFLTSPHTSPLLFFALQSHDLKTPLMSIIAEVDNLRQMLTAACKKITSSLPSVSPVACSVITPPVLQLSKDANNLLDNVNCMIQFLSMSIRRSQDFVKASSDFTLLPVVESFSFADALALVYKCIACQNSGRIVIVHSMVMTSQSFLVVCVSCTRSILSVVHIASRSSLIPYLPTPIR